MTFFKNHAGFNITGDKIQLVEIDFKESDNSGEQAGFYLENVDEEFFNEFLDFSFPETKIINILQSTFNELILRKPLETNFVSFSLPDSFFKIFNIPIDSKIINKDLSDHLKWEVSLLYPDNNPDDFIIRHVERTKDLDSNVNNAVVFSVNKKHLKVIHKFCVRNNLILKFVDNAHIAADTFLTNLPIDNHTASILLDEKYFSVSIIDKNGLEFFKSLQINSINDFLHKLKQEIDILPYFKEGKLNKDVYLSGSFASENLLNKLREITNYNFILLNPFEKIKISPELNKEDFVNKKFYSFSSAAGIALRLI